MKNKILRTVAILFISMVLFGAANACAQEFSADMVSRFGKETMNAKIYVSEGKIRMEMPQGVMIIRPDKNISIMVMPAEQMYMEHPLDNSKAPKVAAAFDNETERTSLGNETVNGYDAEKFKVTYTENGKSVSVHQWIKDGQIPVKIESLDGNFAMEYKNIKLGGQGKSLFEPPASYTKMDMANMPKIPANVAEAAAEAASEIPDNVSMPAEGLESPTPSQMEGVKSMLGGLLKGK